jgi:hypothetical protein
MSSIHATISAWQRQHEDGSYTAEINGWALRVKWKAEGAAYAARSGAPVPPNERRGFTWEAEKDDKKLSGDVVFEEIEHAMGYAEQAVAEKPVAGDAAPAA